MLVEPVQVLGRWITPAVLCPDCTEGDAVAEAERVESAAPSYPEERIRRTLDRLGVNVPAHGRFPLAEVGQTFRREIREDVWRFVRQVREAGRWDPVQSVILEGPTGVGKSWLAVALLRELLETGALQPGDVRYDRSRFLWGAIRQGYGDGTAQRELDARCRCRLWVLDDFGAEHASDDTAANLTDILSAREMRPTIITANIRVDDHGERFDATAWSRIRSRLGERNFRIVTVLGTDHRLRAV